MELIALGAARSGDMAAAHAQAFAAAPWDEAAFAALLEGPGVFALGLEDQAGLAALIMIRAIAGEAEVLTLAVRPARRREGLGRVLLDAALALAGTAGAEQAFLEVAEDNAGALALYERAGFAPAGRRKGYYSRLSGAPVDALLLRKTLTIPHP